MNNIQRQIKLHISQFQINETEKKEMKSKVPQVGRARDLPKIRKKYIDSPNFGLIIDTTITPHCAS